MTNTEQMDERIKGLIVSFLEGTSSLEQEMELQDWIAQSPDNAIAFENLRNIWIITSSKTNTSGYNSVSAWRNVDRTLGKKAVFISPSANNAISRFLKIAAIFIFIFVLGGITSNIIFSGNTASENRICEINTPLGSKTHLVLPDGTQVWLNAGSKLTYPETFDGKDRRVSLTGEAFFKVKTNKAKPFIVKTGHMDVKALGTTFNVKAYPDDKTVTTTLVEGVVKIEGKQGQKAFSYTLKPNQNLVLQKVQKKDVEHIQTTKKQTTIVKELAVISEIKIATEVKTELYTSWKDTRWAIEGESLNSLAVLLERKFNIRIHVKNLELNKYKFTGIIQNETLEQVLQFLSYTTPLEYEIGKGEVWWAINRNKEAHYLKILDKAK